VDSANPNLLLACPLHRGEIAGSDGFMATPSDGAEQIPMVRAIHRISVDTEIITSQSKYLTHFTNTYGFK
jgi:hypothetical protein